MKIFQSPSYDRFSLFDMERRSMDLKSMREVQSREKEQMDKVVISDEGINTLRERLNEINPQSEEPAGYELTIQDTNLIELEHYTAMSEYSGMTWKDGNYNLEDVMKSMLDAYEVRYNEIVRTHENGDRRVTYDLLGEASVTLEEDLAGLDRAYQWSLANLQGYITCQQTNDGSKFFNSTDMKADAAGRKAYSDTAASMMEKARERFLEMREKSDYKEGTGKSIVWNIMSADTDFMQKTRELFAKTIHFHAYS